MKTKTIMKILTIVMIVAMLATFAVPAFARSSNAISNWISSTRNETMQLVQLLL